MRLADYLRPKRAKPKVSDGERLAKTALMRDVLKVLEGTGHESAAKVLRGVFEEYQ
jgi:HD superfamily phosphohydrolase YqeK